MLQDASRLLSLLASLTLAIPVQAVANPGDGVADFALAPAFGGPELSPDGTRISYIAQAQQQFAMVRDLSGGAERILLAVEPERERIRWCDWADDRYVLCGTVSPVRLRDRMAERTRLYSIDVRTPTSQPRELNTALADPARDQVIALMPATPRKVIVQHDVAGRGYPEIAELDVATGALRKIAPSHPPVRRWISDRAGGVRLGLALEEQRASLYVRGDAGWRRYLTQSLNDQNAVGPLAVNRAGELFVLKHHQGRAGLFKMDLGAPPSAALLFAHKQYDVAGPVILHPQTGALLAVRYVAELEETHVFDAQMSRTVSMIDQSLPDRVNVVIDLSQDGNSLLIRSSSPVDAPSLHIFDRRRERLTLVGHQYPALESRPLAAMRPIMYRSRDGERIPGYLTLPNTSDPTTLPAVVLPHGGPETRVWQDYDPLVQFLAAQGYAVLQMNFRGSFGFGAGFASAGVGQWGGVIHNDITDGARWLVEQGIADPARMCIVGESFGGYAALLGAVREAQWYACAASFAGVADLMALARYTERLPDADVWRERLGKDSRALWQMSPMARVHAAETPILIVHGRSDPIAPVRQVRRFARALRQQGKPHTYVERADCDHEMTVQGCRIAWFDELGRFLRTHLHEGASGL